MTNSGRELLLQAVVNRLKAIRRADGYNTTPRLVTRTEPKAVGEMHESELPALFVADGVESTDNLVSRQASCEFSVWIYALIADASGTSAGANAMLWDIKRTLHLVTGLDAASWESGNGQFESAAFSEIEVYRMPQTNLWGIDARLTIKYREPLTLTVSPA